MTYEITLLMSVFISTALVPLLIRVAPRWQLVDVPRDRHVHHTVIPKTGGIGILVGVIVPILMLLPFDALLVSYLGAVTVLAVFGIADDRRELNQRWKVTGQLAAALIVVYGGGVSIERVPFVFGAEFPPGFSALLTVLVLVGITNAINLADGLDGLAGGMALLAFAAMTVLVVQAEDLVLGVIGVAVSGALLGFLRYNSYPARIFMGDTGSQFLGFSAGFMAIVLTERSNAALSPVLPLLLIGLPIIDTLFVMFERLRTGRSPFVADKNHLHHKMMKVGFDHYEAVLFIYLVQALYVTSALALRYESDVLVLTVYVVVAVFVLGMLMAARNRGWQVHAGHVGDSRLRSLIRYFSRNRILTRGPWYFAKVVVPTLFIVSASAAPLVLQDISVLAAALVLLFVVARLWRPVFYALLVKIGIYGTAALCAYLLAGASGSWLGDTRIVEAVIVCLAVSTIVWVRFSGRDLFEVSPLDFLIVFVTIGGVIVGDRFFQVNGLGQAALIFVVLVYTCEMLLTQRLKYRDPLKYGATVALLIIVARGYVGS